jgi:tyrosyl-tRNA synthetase
MIGDPSGKAEERVLLTDERVKSNSKNIMSGLSSILDFDCPKTGAVIRNNADWHTKLSGVEWMRDIGRSVLSLSTSDVLFSHMLSTFC